MFDVYSQSIVQNNDFLFSAWQVVENAIFAGAGYIDIVGGALSYILGESGTSRFSEAAAVKSSMPQPLMLSHTSLTLQCEISLRGGKARLVSTSNQQPMGYHLFCSLASLAPHTGSRALSGDDLKPAILLGRGQSKEHEQWFKHSTVGTITGPSRHADDGQIVNPAVLDSALHLTTLAGQTSMSSASLRVPVAIHAVNLCQTKGNQFSTSATLTSNTQSLFSASLCQDVAFSSFSVDGLETRKFMPEKAGFFSAVKVPEDNKSFTVYWPASSPERVIPASKFSHGDDFIQAFFSNQHAWRATASILQQSTEFVHANFQAISGKDPRGLLSIDQNLGLSEESTALVHGMLRAISMESRGFTSTVHVSSAAEQSVPDNRGISMIFPIDQEHPSKKGIRDNTTRGWGSVLHTPVLTPCSDTLGDQQLPSPVASNNLITGGTGVLGSLVASWLALHSASRLCLLGRTGKASANTLSLLRLDKNSIITIMQCDVAATEDARGLFHGDCKEHLQGIMHAGGVLADATLQKQTAGAARRVFAPKITGLCDQISKQSWLGLQQQVLFSSIAALYGSPGQLNYSGANAVLDAMAHAGRASGMPMLSVQWGAWGGSGMATRDAGTARRMKRLGIGMLQPFDGLMALQAILGDAPGAQVAVTPMVWEVFTRQDFGFPEGFLAEFSKSQPQQTSQARLIAPRSLASHETPPPVTTEADHGAAMRDIVVEAVTGIVGAEVGDMEPLVAAGLDSLGAVELRNSLEERTGLQLSPTLLFDYPTVDEVVAHLQTLVPEARARDQVSLMEADLGHAQAQAQAPSAEYLQQEVSEAVSAILGAQVDLTQPLVAAGIDSLGAVELRNNLEERMGCQLPPTLLFDYPTVSDLAGYLQGHLMASSGVSARPIPLPMDRALVPKQEMARDSHTAVLGMAARLPYDVLGECKARDMVSVVPMGRWDVDGHNGQTGTVTTANRYGVWLDAVADFDAGAFGVPDAEAALMDPQHRLLMETAWEAMQMPGTTQSNGLGVYIGIWHADYHTVVSEAAKPNGPGSASNYVAYHATGTNSSVSAGRLSYTFGLKGPSMSLDTACSASLVAAHLANTAVQSGEIPGALVGGVSLLLEPSETDILVMAQMLSSCGRCQTLDSAADGYGRGEACITMLVGKMDSDGGSNCMAVLYGAAVNQDGRSSSLTAPNGPAQQAVVQAAWSNSSVQINQMRSLQVSLVAQI